jgi:molybdopterin/thiamine biosynthesis adenylyltransferase
MKQSVVLLTDITPTCTELARHLVLSGINLLILASPDLVTQDDT